MKFTKVTYNGKHYMAVPTSALGFFFKELK